MALYTLRNLFNKYGKDATLRVFSDSGSRNNQGEIEWDTSTQSLDVIIGWEDSHPRVLEHAIGESVFVEEGLFALTEDVDLDVQTDAVDKKPQIDIGSESWKVERTIESPDPPGITMFRSQRTRV